MNQIEQIYNIFSKDFDKISEEDIIIQMHPRTYYQLKQCRAFSEGITFTKNKEQFMGKELIQTLRVANFKFIKVKINE